MSFQHLGALRSILSREYICALLAGSGINIDSRRDQNAGVVAGRNVRSSLIVLLHFLALENANALWKDETGNGVSNATVRERLERCSVRRKRECDVSKQSQSSDWKSAHSDEV